MLRPGITTVGPTHQVHFMEEKLLADVSRVRENSSLETHAEVTIRYRDAGMIYQSRLNLTSETARVRDAKVLREKDPTWIG